MSSSITVSAISISDEGERDCPGDTKDGEKLEVAISAVVCEAALSVQQQQQVMRPEASKHASSGLDLQTLQHARAL